VLVARALSRFAHGVPSGEDQALVYSKLIVRPEQVPNAESRILIDDSDRDALGMPRAVMDWRLTPQDWQSASRSAQIVATAFGAAGIGRVRAPRGIMGTEPPPILHGGHHHYGTTKMHPDPRRGVVDADCKVHGIPNLFIASGSVFPTVGYANPMLTLLALSVRVARHLVDRRLARDIPIAS
jgi:choline dehydrogenase-like flavoprotein